VTKFAVHVAQIQLCESCKFGEKIFYSNWDNELFLRDCFLMAHPVYMTDKFFSWWPAPFVDSCSSQAFPKWRFKNRPCMMPQDMRKI